MMTWEETIQFIRHKPEWQYLVDGCYYHEQLEINVERFRSSAEFQETLRLLNKYGHPPSPKLLDIGAGNGVAAVSFSLQGFEVTAIEPDPSDTIGYGAIQKLKAHYQLNNLSIYKCSAEEMPFSDEIFDIVYARQAMHHARNLDRFVAEVYRVLKPGGIYLANRDHVVNDEQQLQKFLEIHPLHKYYGGENAYSLEQYNSAFKRVGFKLIKRFDHLDNIILYDKFISKNYFRDRLSKKLPIAAKLRPLQTLYRYWLKYRNNSYQHIPGRCSAFILRK